MLELSPPEIGPYLTEHSSPQSPLLAELAAETRSSTRNPEMMVGHTEGLLLGNLVRFSGARRVLEIGTFTGYSALAMAERLPDGGKIITCDINEDTTAIARRYWDRSPYGDRIDLRIGPALKTIATIDGPLDMVFIDADKQGYLAYWEACVPKVRPGGLLVADNVLWSAEVLAPRSDQARALARFNRHVRDDKRVRCVMLPVRDGLTLAVTL